MTIMPLAGGIGWYRYPVLPSLLGCDGCTLNIVHENILARYRIRSRVDRHCFQRS
jgi:hypothetical protein